MATTFFPVTTASDVNPGSELELLLQITSRGGGVVNTSTNTVAGPTAGVQDTDAPGGTAVTWISNPLNGVTISGTITYNIWGNESMVAANTGPDVKVERCDGSGVVISQISRKEEGIEYTTAGSAHNFTDAAPTSTTLSTGDRLKFTIFGNDVGTMGSGFLFGNGYSGTTAGVNGDTFVTFTETITEVPPAAGVPNALMMLDCGT